LHLVGADIGVFSQLWLPFAPFPKQYHHMTVHFLYTLPFPSRKDQNKKVREPTCFLTFLLLIQSPLKEGSMGRMSLFCGPCRHPEGAVSGGDFLYHHSVILLTLPLSYFQ